MSSKQESHREDLPAWCIASLLISLTKQELAVSDTFLWPSPSKVAASCSLVRPPDVLLLLALVISTLTRCAAASVAESATAHTRHDVAALAARHDDVTGWAGPRVLPQPAHQGIILLRNVLQMFQVVRMLMLTVAVQDAHADELRQVLLPETVRATLCRTLDSQLSIIDLSFRPLLHAGSAEGVAACMVRPMLIFADRSTPHS